MSEIAATQKDRSEKSAEAIAADQSAKALTARRAESRDAWT